MSKPRELLEDSKKRLGWAEDDADELRAEITKLVEERDDIALATTKQIIELGNKVDRLRAALEIARPYVAAWRNMNESGLTKGMAEQNLLIIDKALANEEGK